MLQCVAVCCSVSLWQRYKDMAMCCGVLQCVLQCVAVCVALCVAVCVGVCCSVLQCVALAAMKDMHGVATISRLLKLQVSFAEYRLFYRALLQKRPIILSSLLIAATPYPLK